MAIRFTGWCPINVRVYGTFSFSLDILSNMQHLQGENIFLTNENLNIKSYLPYLLENKPQVTFFWNEILQRTSVFILLLILNLAVFMHFLFSRSWSIFLLCSLISCLIFESAYSQRSAYFRGNMVCVKFQLIVRKILVLSNLPPQPPPEL